MKNKFLSLTGRENPELIHFAGHLLHPIVIAPLIELKDKARAEIDADIQIVSCYRSFDRQKLIWDKKLSGQKDVLDDNDKVLLKENFSIDEYLLKVLRFSAIPGASRHHWGTDFDIFDAKQIPKENLALTHSECIEQGPCAKLHTWLDNELKNSSSFFRPYNKDLGGVSIEKWHLSYAPLANEYDTNYTIDLFIENIEASSILYKDKILEKSQFYFKNFVKNITQS